MGYAEFLSPSKIRIAASCYCRPLDLPRTLKDSRSIEVIMSLQIHTAVIHGVIWSALWAAMVAVSVHRFPWTIAHDYPADVTECAHILQPSVNQKRLAIVFFVCVFFLLAGTAIFSVFCTYGAKDVSFVTIFCHLWIMAMMWNAVDLLVVDWFMICTLSAKLFIFPGTENCKGNKDYLFHFMGFLKGLIAMTLTALILSGVAFAIMRVIR